jgi:hypothetical protein
MEAVISIQDVANIVTLVAPGYFAFKTYSIIYAKGDKDFSQIVLLSVVFSLPIVAAYTLLFSVDDVANTDVRYALGLVAFSIAIGFACAQIRHTRIIRRLARFFRFPVPEDDFLKLQFAKLSADEAVTVKLKSGELFSGTPKGASKFRADAPRQLSFSNVAWFVRKTKQWEERASSVIVDLNEIEYIETAAQLSKD